MYNAEEIVFHLKLSSNLKPFIYIYTQVSRLSSAVLLDFSWSLRISRSSRSQIFFKIGVLKNFAIFIGKHMCWSLFLIKLQALKPATLLKRDPNTGVFLSYLQKFLRTPFFTQHLRWPGGCF